MDHSPNSLLWGLLLKEKKRLARACLVGRGLGVAWAWRGRGLGVACGRGDARGVGVAWAWRGRGGRGVVGVGAAWAAWAWLVARAWLGSGIGVGVAWAWLGRGVGVAFNRQLAHTCFKRVLLSS